jgi:hypothetical protein
MPRSPITRRDDAALPHEDVPLPNLWDKRLADAGVQTFVDDGADGNATPNGGI